MSQQQNFTTASATQPSDPFTHSSSSQSSSAGLRQHTNVQLPIVPVFPKLPDGTDDGFIILTVGGSTAFYTHVGTLTASSGYFAATLSGHVKHISRTDAGVRHMFVDLDPEVFPHILEFMRCGRMPLLFDEATRKFDIAMYNRILNQAQMLIIPDMEKWILRRRYKHVVTVKTRTRIENGAWDSDARPNDNLDTNGTTSLKVQNDWVSEKNYICQSGLHKTRHNRFPCEQKTCIRALGGREPEWEMVQRPKMTAVREKITYHFDRLDPAWKPPRHVLPPGAPTDWSSADVYRDISDDEENESESEDDDNNR